MGIYERLGVPSPNECVGVGGLTVALIGLTIGVAALFVLEQSFPAFVVIVASLLAGWVSFLYCVVWGESQ